MKLTRAQLINLIRESISEAKYYIGDNKGNVESAIDAYHKGYTKDILTRDIARARDGKDPNEKAVIAIDMMKSKDPLIRQQGREFAYTLIEFGMLDPDVLEDLKKSYSFKGSLVDTHEITDAERTAYDHMPYEKVELDRDGSDQTEILVDKEALLAAMKSKSRNILKYFGFRYVEEQPGPRLDYSDHGPKFRFQAAALGCEVKDLAFSDLDESFPEDDNRNAYNTILEIMREMKPQELPIPGDVGDFGKNNLYDLGGVRVLLTGHFGYYTATICGK